MDSSFADQEKRFILAEMIKASQIDVDAVVGFVKAWNISPDWLEMQIPRGRNVNQCRQAAIAMGIESPHVLPQHHQHYRQLGHQLPAQHPTQHPQPHPQQHPQHSPQHAPQHPPLQQQVPHTSLPSLAAKRKTTDDSSEHAQKRLAMATAEMQPVSQPRSIQPRPQPQSADGPASVSPSTPTAYVPQPQSIPRKRGRPSRSDKGAHARALGSFGHPLPSLAPASKPAVENQTTVAAAAKVPVKDKASSLGPRGGQASRRSFEGSPASDQGTKTAATDLHLTPLKKEQSPTQSSSEANLTENQAPSTPNPKPKGTAPNRGRVAVTDLVKTAASAVMTTGV